MSELTKVEQLVVDAGKKPYDTFEIERQSDVVLGEFVGFDAGRNRGSWVEQTDEGIFIVFSGRVGGGNRDDWEDVWKSFYRNDWAFSAADDDGDNTYASFRFLIPEDRLDELWTLYPKASVWTPKGAGYVD